MSKDKKQKGFKMYLKTISKITCLVLIDEGGFNEDKVKNVTNIVSDSLYEITREFKTFKGEMVEKDFERIRNIFREKSLQIASIVESFTPEEDFVTFFLVETVNLNIKIRKMISNEKI